MLSPLGEAQRHHIAGFVEGVLRDVSQEGLVEGLERVVLVGKHIPGCRLALKDSQVVVGVDKAAGQAAEEDADLERRHFGIAIDDAPLVAVAIEEKQAILATQRYARLVEQAVVESDVLTLRFRCNLNYLERLEPDFVSLGEGHHIGDQHRSRRREATHRQASLQDSVNAAGQLKTLL